ncbi:hypothetical protein ACQ86N_21490 [Puia sp. P3]|uniref:hypothetical protein n=1 Tax=Puia sp. P3 TaxID=3423952 RepID=UPI003D6689AB
MKKILRYILFPLLAVTLVTSCHKLNEAVTSELAPGAFPADTTQYPSVVGPMYVVLRGNYAVEYFFQQTYSTDEGIMPARGGNWFDGAQNQQMHYHSSECGQRVRQWQLDMVLDHHRCSQPDTFDPEDGRRH